MKTKLSLLLVLFMLCSNICALEQQEKAWSGIQAQQTLSADQKWRVFEYAQLRLINHAHPVQDVLGEIGLGYQFLPDKTLWFGYRLALHQPYNEFYQENRLFQQLVLVTKPYYLKRFAARSRLEESNRSNQSQVSVRFREKLAIELDHSLFQNVYPFFYDEVFFQLKKTSTSSPYFVNQNRLFLGFNLYLKPKTFWEIGYINQYQRNRPSSQMSHILSFTYYA